MDFNKELFDELLLHNLEEIKNKTDRKYDVKYKILKKFNEGFVVKMSFSSEDIRNVSDTPIMDVIKSNDKAILELVDVLDTRFDSDQEYGFGKHFILLINFKSKNETNLYDKLFEAVDKTCLEIRNKLTDIDNLGIDYLTMYIEEEEFHMNEDSNDNLKEQIIKAISNHDYSESELSMNFYTHISINTSRVGSLFNSLIDLMDITTDLKFQLSNDKYVYNSRNNYEVDRICVDGYDYNIDCNDEEVRLDFRDVECFANGSKYSISKELEFNLSFSSYDDVKEFFINKKDDIC